MAEKYDHIKVEKKWSRRWLEGKLYQPDLEKAKKPYYNLMMFPYPSADGLHVGNMYAFTGADMNGRYRRMMGDDVFQPIGLDGFGIHSENYAIKVGKHPAEQAKVSEERFYDQLSKIGNGFAWDNRLETYDPEYYKWTQWIFCVMFKAGLAYRKKARVNWCPSCKTVLADEQVEGGVCERCKSETTYKDLEQWFFRITAYADRLLKDIELLDWPEKIKQAQRQWIGKSEGVKETWQIKGMNAKLETFTTWPHTTWGATFIVLAPEHPMIEELVRGANKELEVREFVKVIIEEKQRNRIDAEKVKKGIDTGRVAINPLTGWEMPIWVANFAVMDYGTGIVKGCPAHDERDFEFARKFHLPIRKVIDYDSETHSVVVKKSVGSDFTTKIEQAGWYFVDYEGWGYGVVVPKGDEQKYIDLVQSSLKRGPWYVHTDGRAKVVIYQDRIFKVESENEQAKEYGRNLNIPEEQLDWDNPEHYMFCYVGQGMMVNAGEFSGMKTDEAKEAVTKKAIEMGYGERMTDYHLRDWLISRQRYWGPPIPMIFCPACAEQGKSWVNSKLQITNDKQISNSKHQELNNGDEGKQAGWWPMGLNDLPVRLPDLEDWQPKGDGKGPLENAPEEWLYVTCPKCGERAKRETDVSDTFLDSAWYFLAYPNLGTKAWKGMINNQLSNSKQNSNSNNQPQNNTMVPWEEEIIKKWLPVDAYIGGAEHAVLHLLYARFVWKVLMDLGHIPELGKERAGGLEPFPFLFGHGLIIKDGAKMSKSRGNVVNPDEYIEQYGADALRMYLMFLGPYDQGGDFRDSGMAGMKRFLDRVWRLVMDSQFDRPNSSRLLISKLQETIAKCGKEMAAFRYNTTIASLMELTNSVKAEGGWGVEEKRFFVKLLAPLAPFMAEEMWEQLSDKTPSISPLLRGRTESVHYQEYPRVDESKVIDKPVVVVVQVNGKTRASLEIQNDKWKMLKGKEDVVSIANENEHVAKHLLGKEVVKTVWVEPRAGKQGLVNFVVR